MMYLGMSAKVERVFLYNNTGCCQSLAISGGHLSNITPGYSMGNRTIDN